MAGATAAGVAGVLFAGTAPLVTGLPAARAGAAVELVDAGATMVSLSGISESSALTGNWLVLDMPTRGAASLATSAGGVPVLGVR